MKKLSVYPFLLLLSFTLSHFQALQAQNRISGTIQDSDGKPLAYATVLLLNARDSSLVHGGFSTDQGTYQFEVETPGNFMCAFSMLGFKDVYSKTFEFEGIAAEKQLETVVLVDNSALLSEVTVVAKRPFLEQKIDRTIVNVANSITNAGGTALQVLQRSPGVQVNALSKTISLSGKEGVIVMINGKITRLPAEAVVDMLSGMNSDNIDHIELIHTPPANFEAEGNAGVINIVLKTSGDDGFNGGYSAKAGYGRGPKYGAGSYFNYRKNKINLFGNYEYDFNLNPQVFTNYRGVLQGNDFLETDTYSDRSHTPTTTQNARLGADFQVSKKTVIGVLGTFFDSNWYMEAVNSVKYLKNGAVDSLLQMPNTETNHNRSYTANINLSHQFSKQQSLSLDADYLEYNINNPSYYRLENMNAAGTITSLEELRISKKTPIKAAVAKGDYTLNFGKNSKFETGAKFTALRFNNDVQVDEKTGQQDWVMIPEYTSLFHLNEDVLGAYGTLSSKLDAKTDLKAGVRYEYTKTNLGSVEMPNVVDRQYGSWFPSIFLARKMSETQTLNLSYSRRIGRPPIKKLAPWLIFSDPTTLEGGNPALQPSFTDALKLGYVLKSWNFGVSYSIENEPIRYVPMVDLVNNRQINTSQNLDNQKVLSADLSFPLSITSWWKTRQNFYLNSTEINLKLEGKSIKISNVNYGFNMTQTFQLPQNFTFELSGDFNSPGYWGIAYWKANGSLGLGLEKNFGEKWGKLRFATNDLFLSSNWFGTTQQAEIGLFVKSSFQFAERTFLLSWTNTFGNQKLKSARQRQTGAAEEMRRI